MADYYIGLMSGTSIDGMDAVLVDFSINPPTLVATHSEAFDERLRTSIMELTRPDGNEIERLAQLDRELGNFSAQLCQQLLHRAGVLANEVTAIGSHGQTIRHAPNATPAYTLQIGDPNTIAQLSGITTVADFRRRDLVVGGQGAPLVPAFHQSLFRSNSQNRVILNIGGIANISILPADASLTVTGFDTGPGNMLMDAWVQFALQQPYDHNGDWARSGQNNTELLTQLQSDPFFSRQPPKSTGREQYNLQWLRQQLRQNYPAEDVQATLCELSATTIASAITQFAPKTDEVFVCGGGARNSYLIERISALLDARHVTTTAALGIDPQSVEAMAFAWLAYRTLKHLSGNLPAVTGASEEVILGGIYPAGPAPQLL